MSKILITGSAGFIGSALVEYLTDRNHEITGLDIKSQKLKPAGVRSIVADIQSKSWFDEVDECPPEIVIHLAARTDLKGSTDLDYRINKLGTERVIEYCQTRGVRHLVFFSTMLVSDWRSTWITSATASTPYGQSKLDAEAIVAKIDNPALKWTILRPTSVWGPGHAGGYSLFFKLCKRGLYLDFLPRVSRKPFCFIGNLCFITDLLSGKLSPSSNRKIFYLADYPTYGISEMAYYITAKSGTKVMHIPPDFVLALGRIGDILMRLGVSFPVHSQRIANMLCSTEAPTQNLKSLIGELPYDLEAGIDATLRWMNESHGS